MRQYFIHDGQQQLGPFTLETIKDQKISKATKVWHDGLTDWTTLENVSELVFLINTPPPFQPISSAPPPLPTSNFYDLESESKKKSQMRAFIIAGCLLAAVSVGWLIYSNKSQAAVIEEVKQEQQSQAVAQQQKEAEEKRQEEEKQQALQAEQQRQEDERKRINDELTQKNMNYRKNWADFIKAERTSFTYREIGGISDLSVIFTNRTEYMLDEVVANVHIIKSNGDIWKIIEVPISNVPAGSQKTIAVPDQPRGTDVTVSIKSVTCKKMHFCFSEMYFSGNGDDPHFCK